MGRRDGYESEMNLAVVLIKAIFQLIFQLGKGLLWLFRKNTEDKEKAKEKQLQAKTEIVDTSKEEAIKRVVAALDSDLSLAPEQVENQAS